MSSLRRVSLLSVSGTSSQVLCIITFSIAPPKLQRTPLPSTPHVSSAAASPSNYPRENLATPFRIRFLASSFAFSRPTEPGLIFILEVTSVNVLRRNTFIFLLRGRIRPQAPRPQIASTDAATRAGQNKYRQIKYRRPRSPEKTPRNSSQVNLPVFFPDFVISTSFWRSFRRNAKNETFRETRW